MPLKTLVYGKSASARWPRKSSKRRDVLSVNMISLPLADFRHVSHIGNNAHSDSFGDLSFLKRGHSLLLQSSRSEQNLFLADVPPPKPPRLNQDHSDHADWTTNHVSQTSSERRKKYSSLPLLDSEEGEMEKEEEMEGSVSTTQSLRVFSHSPVMDRVSTQDCPKDTLQLDEVDNSFSFSLDLGPSILDDVLQVMDRLHY